MKKLKNIHPGEILHDEFLLPLEISAYKLSKDIGIPQTRISSIVKGNRRITADTATTSDDHPQSTAHNRGWPRPSTLANDASPQHEQSHQEPSAITTH